MTAAEAATSVLEATLGQFDTTPALPLAGVLRAEGQALLDAAQKVKDDAAFRVACEAVLAQHAADPTRFCCEVNHSLTRKTVDQLEKAGYTVTQQAYSKFRLSW